MSSNSDAQLPQVNYALHSLGWKAFQDLCATITGEVLGQTIQLFLDSYDGGRDGAFQGTWNAQSGEAFSGTFTIQCKHTSSQSRSLSLGNLQDEIEKTEKLAARGLADTYILMTNYKISGNADADIRDSFLGIDGVKHFICFGYDWITHQIKQSPRLRMLVPRIYGLGDLTQILDERAYTQASNILSSIGGDIDKLVVTEAHRRAARALVDQGFVLLLGEPAAGKSTIAASLALGAVDNWGCNTIRITSSDEFVQHWNPNEPNQLFWVDDAFGTTQYVQTDAFEWNRVFPHMQAAIQKGSRIIFTSRDYIYQAALADLKVGSFPLLNESQVIINVQELTRSEKQQILYNHIKLGTQPEPFRQGIKPFLPAVANNRYFLPEIARRLGNPLFTQNLYLHEDSIREYVEKPVQFLNDVISTIDRESKAALALIFMNGGTLSSPIFLSEQDVEALGRLGGTISGVREALVAMNSSLVMLQQDKEGANWTFKHPTIRDAFTSYLSQDPELVDIYIIGTRIETLIREVTCGEIDIRGSKVVLPRNRYSSLIHRLVELESRDRLFAFLTNRCEAQFVKEFFEAYHGIWDEVVNPNSYLSYSAKVRLLAKMHHQEILPEVQRRKFVSRVEWLAVHVPDAAFLSDNNVRILLEEHETQKILAKVQAELVPRLEEIISGESSSFDPQMMLPEEHFSQLKDALETYRSAMTEDDAAIEAIDEGVAQIEGEIDGLNDEYDVDFPDRMDDDYGTRNVEPDLSDRNIFDDVDEFEGD